MTQRSPHFIAKIIITMILCNRMAVRLDPLSGLDKHKEQNSLWSLHLCRKRNAEAGKAVTPHTWFQTAPATARFRRNRASQHFALNCDAASRSHPLSYPPSLPEKQRTSPVRKTHVRISPAEGCDVINPGPHGIRTHYSARPQVPTFANRQSKLLVVCEPPRPAG